MPFDSLGVPCLAVSTTLTRANTVCHSLQGNKLDDSAMQQLEAAAGDRIKLSL